MAAAAASSMMKSRDSEVSSADLGIGVVLRRGGEVLNEGDLDGLRHAELLLIKASLPF